MIVWALQKIENPGHVFGKSFYQVVGSDWFNFYSDRYNADSRKRRFPNTAELKLNIPKKALIENIILSPQADFIAYTEHNQGLRKVVLFNLQTNVQKVIFSEGEKDFSGDYEKNYPLIKWSPDNESLIILYEKNDKVKILGKGELTKGLDISAHAFSTSCSPPGSVWALCQRSRVG